MRPLSSAARARQEHPAGPYEVDPPAVRRLYLLAVWAGSIASLLVSLGLANIWFNVGSVRGHYIAQYSQFFSVRVLWIAALAGASAIAILWWSDALVHRREWAAVLLWLAAALALQAMLRSLTFTTFERNIRSPGAFSFYTTSEHYPARLVLSDFERLRPEMPLHAQSNMPGKLMFMYALELVTDRPDVLPWLIVVVSNLGGIPLYLFARDLFGSRTVALYSLALYSLMPARLFFLPVLNTVTPVIVLLLVLLVLRWLRSARAAYAAAIGVLVYALAFFEPTALSIGLLPALLMAHALWTRTVGWRTLMIQGSLAVAAFAAVYLVLLLGFRFDLFSTMHRLGVDAAGFNVRHNRPYAIWVRQNAIDFFFGVGVCQTALAAVACGRRGAGAPIVIVSAAITSILVVIDLLGVNRGEVIRLWLFLACFFQLPAAYVCARLRSRTAMSAVLATTVLQDALGTYMIGFIGF